MPAPAPTNSWQHCPLTIGPAPRRYRLRHRRLAFEVLVNQPQGTLRTGAAAGGPRRRWHPGGHSCGQRADRSRRRRRGRSSGQGSRAGWAGLYTVQSVFPGCADSGRPAGPLHEPKAYRPDGMARVPQVLTAREVRAFRTCAGAYLFERARKRGVRNGGWWRGAAGSGLAVPA
jgi:hypothetical protein